MKNPLVSVIIPTKDRQNFLKIALESVLKQTFSDFEVIIVNDGGENIDSFIHNFNDRRLISLSHPYNKGPSAARNTALNHARGKYIAYLDDDDIFYEIHLELLVKALSTSDFHVAYTDGSICHKRMVNSKPMIEKNESLIFDITFEKLLINNFMPPIFVMHEKVCLDEVGYFDETLRRHEDWDLWLRLFQKYPFLHISEATAEYSQWEGQVTSLWVGNFLHTMQIIHYRYRSLAKNNAYVIEEQKEARARLRIYMMRHLEKMSELEIKNLQLESNMEDLFSSVQFHSHDDITETLAIVDYLTKRVPDNARFWLTHGKLSLLLGYYREASFAIMRSLELQETKEALVTLAATLEKGKAPEEAAKIRDYIEKKGLGP